MLLEKRKIAATVVAIAGLLAMGGEVQAQRQPAKDSAQLKGKIGAIDVENRKVTLVTTTFDRKAAEATEKETVLTLAKDAALLQDGAATKLEDLKRGYNTTVKSDGKTAFAITVEGNTIKGQFKSMNAERNTITVIAGRDMGEKIYHLLKTTKVTMDGGKLGKAQDLQAGVEIVLTLSVLGDNTVITIQPSVVEKKNRGER